MERKYTNWYRQEHRKPHAVDPEVKRAVVKVMDGLSTLRHRGGEIVLDDLPFKKRVALLNYLERHHRGLRNRADGFVPVRLEEYVGIALRIKPIERREAS